MLHLCQCPSCQPELFPSGPRQGEHHVAVRFNDTRITAYPPFRAWSITLDGVHVEHICNEALAGTEGLVVLHSTPLHLCACLNDQCQYVRTGTVTIALR